MLATVQTVSMSYWHAVCYCSIVCCCVVVIDSRLSTRNDLSDSGDNSDETPNTKFQCTLNVSISADRVCNNINVSDCANNRDELLACGNNRDESPSCGMVLFHCVLLGSV